MLYNYHNHTSRCRHVTGELRESFEKALKMAEEYKLKLIEKPEIIGIK